MAQKSEEQSPRHLKLIHPLTRWDWRRENPVELLVLIFAVVVFFLLPRQSCGITEPAAVQVEISAPGESAPPTIEVKSGKSKAAPGQ